jgi:hypothetical protein
MSSARASADIKKDVPSPETTQKSGEAQSEGSSKAGTPEADEAPSDSNAKPAVPMQKRRRVTRACDEISTPRLWHLAYLLTNSAMQTEEDKM